MKFSSFVRLFGSRWQASTGPRRRAKSRRARLETAKNRPGIELLEDRTLMSVLPVPTVTGQADVSSTFPSSDGLVNQYSPQVAVDPLNPNKIVTAYTIADEHGTKSYSTGVNYSSDGGQTWQSLFLPGNLVIPSDTKGNSFPYTTDARVAFDRGENVYLLVNEHTTGEDEGALVLQKYSFSGSAPAQTVTNKVVYEWTTSGDQANETALTVDSNVSNFVDPTAKGSVSGATNTSPIVITTSAPHQIATGQRVTIAGVGGNTAANGTFSVTVLDATHFSLNGSAGNGIYTPGTGTWQVQQSDIFADNPTTAGLDGDVYVGWNTTNQQPANTNGAAFNSHRLRITSSSDGGTTFGPSTFIDQTGDFTGQNGPRYGTPQLTVSQGTANGSVAGGQLTTVYDDFNSGAAGNPAFDIIDATPFPLGAISTRVAGTTGSIPPSPTPTSFTADLSSYSDTRFSSLSNISVTLSILNFDPANTTVDLVAPDGTSARLLFSGNAGITGGTLGINTTTGVNIGTEFNDNATRSIKDGNSSAPFIGVYRPQTPLSVFLGKTLDVGKTTGVAGAWHLVFNYNPSTAPTTLPSLVSWSLAVTSGLTPGFATQVTTTFVRGTFTGPTSGNSNGHPLTPPAAPTVGFGPGAVIASDNTLGAFSPFQGRLYLAYTDREPTGGNQPSSNTDVFLVSSDNGGTSWTIPTRVSDDRAVTDGFSGNFTGITGSSGTLFGRTQFAPSVAVDQTTGTLVMTYLDTRYDAANARTADMIATSIDGGGTFGPQTFANTPQVVVDAITGKQATLGPIPDNESSANVGPTAGAPGSLTHSFVWSGPTDAVAVTNGHVYPVWNSNQNGGVDGKQALDIWAAPTVIASGPRIVSSTMGPVKPITLPSGISSGSNNTSMRIPTNGTGGTGNPLNDTTSSSIVISGDANNVVGALTVNLSLTHSKDSDLVIALIAPDNTIITLSQNRGGSGADYTNTTFDDTSTVPIASGAAPFTGTFQPDQPLRTLAGKSANGTWKLQITDTAAGNTGTLLGWSLSIQTSSSFNNTTAADGTALANGFEITFDRPVDPNTVTPNDVRVAFRNTVAAATDPGVALNVLSVQPLDQGPFGPAGAVGATKFIVRFDPSAAQTTDGTYTGTYSYTVGPEISDRIRSTKIASVTVGPATVFTAVPPQVPLRVPPSGNGGSNNINNDVTFSSIPVTGLSGTVAKVTVTLTITSPNDQDLEIGLFPPTGNGVLLAFAEGGANGQNYTGTTFDDAAATPISAGSAPFAGSFKPEGPLSQLNGINPNGTWQLFVYQFRSGSPGTLVSWSLSISTGGATTTLVSAPGNQMDQNANALNGEDPSLGGLKGQKSLTPGDVYAVPRPAPLAPIIFTGNFFPPPYAGDSLPLIVSGPHVVSTSVPNNPTTTDNTVLSAVSYKSSGAVTLPANTTTDAIINVADLFTIKGATLQLDIADPNDANLTGTLIAPDGTRITLFSGVGAGGVNFSQTVFDDLGTTPIAAGTAPFNQHRFQPTQALAALVGKLANVSGGNWILEIANNSPTNAGTLNSWSLTFQKDATVSAIDVTFDRDMDPTSFTGADVLGMVGPIGQIGAPVTYNSANVPVTIADGAPQTFTSTDTNKPIPDAAGSTPGTLVSTLSIPNAFLIGDLNVQVTITHPRDADLSLTLIAPDGHTSVQLVPANGTVGANFNGTIFDDGAAAGVGSGVGPFTGSYRPVQPLSSLNGINIHGTWTLLITDSTAGNVGTLNSWSLIATAPTASSTLSVNNAVFPLQALQVQLNATHPHDNDLSGFLVAPDGTIVQLFAQNGGAGQNYTNTVFDDSATKSISAGSAPFTGIFQPLTPLSALQGKNINGTWTLYLTDSVPGNTGPQALNAWSLVATPAIFTVTADPPGTPANLAKRVFRVTFPTQNFSGTYSLVLASSINSSIGEALDTNQNAGLDDLRGVTQGGKTVTETFASSAATAIAASKQSTSTITIPDDFLIQNLTLTLNATYPTDHDLQATLIAPDGTKIQLFTNLGASNSTGPNFINTVFDDSASTPIQNGAPSFTGRFDPQLPLSALDNHRSGGTWQLVITNTGSSSGTINSWSLTLAKSLPSTGLGEPVADQATVGFRIFAMDPTNPLASGTWTAVGPASISGSTTAPTVSQSGSVTAVAIDPSDPSNNTVFVGGASGGIWKTTNFMTTDPRGPTYVPLTNLGPTSSLNIGSIALFGRNNNPAQTVVFAATGVLTDLGNGGINNTTGIGFLRSMDGGQTWQLLDSTSNDNGGTGVVTALADASRNHLFDGGTINKVVVDPKAQPNGQLIIYAAISGIRNSNSNNVGGIYRSLDSGLNWTLMTDPTTMGTDPTDVLLDQNSGQVDAVSNPTGNLDIVYAAFSANNSSHSGIWQSPNRGQTWNQIVTGIGDPGILQNDTTSPHPTVPVNGTNDFPSNPGRITLAQPALTGNPVQDTLYEGWLYALVVTPSANGTGRLNGLYLTKDHGQNWTKVRVPSIYTDGSGNANPAGPFEQGLPTNDSSFPDEDPFGSSALPGGLGNYAMSLTVDPNNPAVVYVGGVGGFVPTGLMRVDTTGLSDAHSLYLNSAAPDGGQLAVSTTSAASLQRPIRVSNTYLTPPNVYSPITGNLLIPQVASLNGPTASIDENALGQTLPVINFLQDPTQPFLVNTTLLTTNTKAFGNTGDGAKWTPFDAAMATTQNVHTLLAIRNPLTGQTQLLIGNDEGVFSGLDKGDGTIVQSIGDIEDLSLTTGNVALPVGSRNGNLQLTPFTSSAVQPSGLAAQVAGALLYGASNWNGLDASSADLLTTGNIAWTTSSATSNWYHVTTDQQGTGTVYRTAWPGTIDSSTTVAPGQPTVITTGPQYQPQDFFQVNGVSRTTGLLTSSTGSTDTHDNQWPDFTSTVFAVSPLNSNDIIISSRGNGFGAANGGNIFQTTNQGKFWSIIASRNVLDGFNAEALTYGAPDPNNPQVGTSINDLIYAGTLGGNLFVTFTGGGNNGTQWINISRNSSGASVLDGSAIEGIVANPNRGSHEIYVITQNHVYHYADTATFDPTNASTNPVNVTGNLPIGSGLFPLQQPTITNGTLMALQVDWRYSLPNVAGGTNPVLYVGGEGGVYRSLDGGTNWALFPHALSAPNGTSVNNQVGLDGTLLPNDQVTSLSTSLGNVNATTGQPQVSTGTDLLVASTFGLGDYAIRLAPVVVLDAAAISPALNAAGELRSLQPNISGTSEQTAFGNTVRVDLLDMSDPNNANPPVIGTGTTDATGHFSIQVKAGYWKADGSSDGNKVIGVRAIDDAGVVGQVSTVTFFLDTRPNLITGSVKLDPSNPAPGGSDSGLSASDAITSIQQPFIFGQVDEVAAGMFVNLFDVTTPGSHVPVGSGVTTATGSTPNGQFSVQVNPPFTTQGAHKIEVDVSNSLPINAANGTTLTYIFVLDSIAPAQPAAPTLAPAADSGVKGDNVTNATALEFTGFVEVDPDTALLNNATQAFPPAPTPPTRVSIYADGNLLTPVATGLTTAATGAYDIILPGVLGEGTHTFQVQQTDLAGNLSPMSAVQTIIIDRTAPPVPPLPTLATDSGIAGDNITNVNTPTFTGTVQIDPNGANGGLGADTINVYVDNSAQPVASTFTDPTTGNYSVTLTAALSDGSHTIQIQQVDVAGNASGKSAALTVTIDTTKPVAPAAPTLVAADDTGVSQSDHITQRTTPTFTGVAPKGEANDTVTLFATSNAPGAKPIPVGSSIVTSSLSYSVTVSSPLTDGQYAIQVQLTDVAGNVGALSPAMTPSLVVITSASAPTLALAAGSDTGASSADHVTRTNTPTFTGTASPNAAVKIFGNGNVIGTGTASASGTYSVTTQPLADGSYTITAQQTDVAGNISPLSAPLSPSLTVDTSAPVAPAPPSLTAASDSGVSNSDHVTNVNRPSFTGTGEPNTQATIFATNVNTGVKTAIAQGTVTASGTYALTATVALGDGTYNVTVQLSDTAGNVGAESAAMQPQLLILTTPPTTPTLKLDPSTDTGTIGDNRTASNPQLFNGTAQAGTAVTIKDGGAVLTTFPETGSTFQITLNLADGTHPLTVVSTDVAGNVSTSAVVNVVIDPNELTPDFKYIRALYLQSIGRSGTQAEWSYWETLLSQPDGRKAAANGIGRSAEGRAALLQQWYETYLGRTAQAGEVQFWVNAFLAGATEEQVLAKVLASGEYYFHAPSIQGVSGGTASDSTFIQALYLQLLGRAPNSGEIGFWTSQTASQGREAVVLNIENSAVYRADNIIVYYQTLLGRTPSQAEVNGWVFSALDLASIRIGFEYSGEYYTRVTGTAP